jgi:hypothetical protein
MTIGAILGRVTGIIVQFIIEEFVLLVSPSQCISVPVILVASIKDYVWPAKQCQTTHLLPVIQLRITACRAWKSYTGALGRI